jgi:Cys-tRNA(Pro)/Cys-tRNA(Cys) deacylase
MVDERSGSERVREALNDLGIDASFVHTAPASSAEESARFQSIDLSQLLKTIVVRKGDDDYVFVLVPGNRAIDWKKLRNHLGVSRASLPERSEAERITGYSVGTITPFGSATPLPIVLDVAAMAEPKVTLGAGERGVNVHVEPVDIQKNLGAEIGDVTKTLD